MSWPWGTYLGEEALRNGIRVKISSWQRVGPNVIPHARRRPACTSTRCSPSARPTAPDTRRRSCSPPRATSPTARARASSSSSDGVIYTPDLSASILVGITRDTVIQIAQDLGYSVVEKPLIRTDLYLADEVFMVGTAAEVTPIREVDDHVVGPPGPVTLEMQQAYLDTVHGRSERWAQWLEYAPSRTEA